MIKVRQVKLDVRNNDLKKEIASKLKTNVNNIIDYTITKESIDSRKKPQIFYIYEVNVTLKNENEILKNNHSNDISLYKEEEYSFNDFGSEGIKNRIVIVGSGPSGLFCSYMLSKNGYKPLIIERGSCLEERIKKVNDFWDNNKLDPECNVQFGEGGAGTFSDGKLNTLIKDTNNRMKEVFKTFVKFGSPEDIMYKSKPHIGTDILRDVIKNMRNEIIKLGGEFRFNTKLTSINYENNKLTSIIVNDNEEIKCDVLVLAIGHSSRDTFEMLNKTNLELKAKAFAIGVRVQHKQSMINESQYGKDYYEGLENASYKLTHTCQNNRGVYTFCMCPGGYVVNSSSEKGMLAINGMSYRSRDSKNANSAVIVTISPNDFGNGPLDGMHFQRELEKKTYNICNGKIPTQTFKDYLDNKKSNSFKSVEPLFKGNYDFANLNEIFPDYINESLKEGINNFGKKIKGFNDEDTLISAIESRTSSPIKIIRDENFESSIKGIYPCGEGAGYAGGITSSSIDGIKVFEAIAKKYKRSEIL